MTKPLAQVLLAPQSVAIIGQSNDATKTAGRPLKYLRQAGYAGRIYPINPRRDEVLGERAWPSLAELPELPEHAYIVASTDATMEAIEECAKAGVPVVTALANGFSETGDEGTAREARIKAIIQETGTRLVGPSSLGVVDLRHKAFMTANAAFDEPDLPVGRIFAASHSGGMIGTFLSRGKARGIHFAGLVSVGNEVDLSIGEICAAMKLTKGAVTAAALPQVRDRLLEAGHVDAIDLPGLSADRRPTGVLNLGRPAPGSAPSLGELHLGAVRDRILHDTLHQLGVMPKLKDAADGLPDARSRREPLIGAHRALRREPAQRLVADDPQLR